MRLPAASRWTDAALNGRPCPRKPCSPSQPPPRPPIAPSPQTPVGGKPHEYLRTIKKGERAHTKPRQPVRQAVRAFSRAFELFSTGYSPWGAPCRRGWAGRRNISDDRIRTTQAGIPPAGDVDDVQICRSIGYQPRRWLNIVHKWRGDAVEAASEVITSKAPDQAHDGFAILWEKHHLWISLEQRVLEWPDLFRPAVLDCATKRLAYFNEV